jgi:hypothetical protein
MLLVCARRRFTLDRKGLTSGDQNITVTHDLSHEPGPVTPPLRNWCGVVVKMALAFVLDVEREDMVREVFPFWSAFDQRIRVLQNMGDAVVEVRHTFGVGIPGCDIVITSLSVGAIERRQVIFVHIRIVSPAS